MAHSLKVLDKANSYIMLQKSYLLFMLFVHVASPSVGGITRMSMEASPSVGGIPCR